MSFGCIKGEKGFDVNVSYIDCKTIVIEDLSIWMPEEEGYTVPDTYNARIRIPDLDVDTHIDIKGVGLTKITSVDLLQDSEPRCLPSSVIHFEFESCGLTHYTSKVYMCKYQCAIDGMFARGEYERASELESLVKGVEAAVASDMIETAKNTLEILSRKLKNEKCGSCG